MPASALLLVHRVDGKIIQQQHSCHPPSMPSLESLGDDLVEIILSMASLAALLPLVATSQSMRARAALTLLQKSGPCAESWRRQEAETLRMLMWKSSPPIWLRPLMLATWKDVADVPPNMARTLMRCCPTEARFRRAALHALQGRSTSIFRAGLSDDDDDDDDDDDVDDDDRVVDGVRTVILHVNQPEPVRGGPSNLGRHRGRAATKSCGAYSGCDGSCRTYVGDDGRLTQIVLLLRRHRQQRQYAIEKRTRLVRNKHKPGSRFHRAAWAGEWGGDMGSSSGSGGDSSSGRAPISHWHGRECGGVHDDDLQCCCHLDDNGRPGGLSQRLLEIPGMASSIRWRAWEDP